MPTRNLVSHLVGGGLAVLSNPLHKAPARRVAGGSRRALPATHMLTWQEGRLWLHQLQGATWLGWGEDEAFTAREGARGARYGCSFNSGLAQKILVQLQGLLG
jgi:hypothetical protein